jgi:hypothetical protein
LWARTIQTAADASARIIGIFSESALLREEGKGEDGSPWLQMIVGPAGSLPSRPDSEGSITVVDLATDKEIRIL